MQLITLIDIRSVTRLAIKGMSYSQAESLRSKGHSPICERVLKMIVEYFKNNIPQHKITMALQISSSTVHHQKIQINWRNIGA